MANQCGFGEGSTTSYRDEWGADVTELRNDYKICFA
jgi:hypothetical protein